jgi:hypothetical protein
VTDERSAIILGITRSDTKPAFFARLHAAGFDYCLIDTEACEGTLRHGSNFGLFSLTRSKPVS